MAIVDEDCSTIIARGHQYRDLAFTGVDNCEYAAIPVGKHIESRVILVIPQRKASASHIALEVSHFLFPGLKNLKTGPRIPAD